MPSSPLARARPPLVEREPELAALGAAVEDAAAGRGRTVALVGEPGIGKSCLLATAREQARDAGMLVCSARGAELERAFPFGAVRQLAASSYADTTTEERASWFAGVAALAAPLFREEAIVEGSAEASYPRLHALYWLCANAARRRPLVLIIDDAHWIDDASLAFAGFLARRVAELPLLLLIGTRPPGADAGPELVQVLADPETTTVSPGLLSPAAVATLLRPVLGREPDPEFAAACHAATDGNPFLLCELADEVRTAGIEPVAAESGRVAALIPAGVRTMTQLRLARLSASARRLAGALALLGDHTMPAVVAELAGIAEADAAEAVGELEAAGIVARDEGIEFVHPLLRAAVTEDISPAERAAGHAAAAVILDRREAPADVVALQLLRTEPARDAWAVTTLRAGARRALALGDPEVAAAYVRRALSEGASEVARSELLLELGLAQARFDRLAALASLEQAMDEASTPDLRGRAALQLGALLSRMGRADAADLLEQALATLDGDPELTDALRAELVASAFVRVSTRRRLDPLIGSLHPPAGPPTTPLELLTVTALAAEAALERGDPEPAAELACSVLDSAAATDGPMLSGHVQLQLIVALIVTERLDEAETAATASLQAARDLGSTTSAAFASGRRALVRLRKEDLAGAEADALACLDLLAGEPGAAPITMLAAGAAVLAGVQLGRAPADLERTIAHNGGDPDYPGHTILLLADAALGTLGSDWERALAACDRCAGYDWLRDCVTLLPWRSISAPALARLGRPEEAHARAREEVVLARETRLPRPLAVALRTAAALAPDDGAREPLLEEATAILDGGPLRVELARSLLARGALRRRSGLRTLAREDLQRAHDLAASRGAVRVAEAAAAELRSSGARLRRMTDGGADALTPSERRVAELAAGGLTNREIAQSLFLSEKTVEAHLGRTYRKLEIRSRVRLAAALGPRELLDG